MRALLMACIGVERAKMSVPSFTVLLGANETGRDLLKSIKKAPNLPIITKQADYTKFGTDVIDGFELLMSADSIWNLSLKEVKESGAEMKKTPYIQ